jgi:NAD+ kinase
MAGEFKRIGLWGRFHDDRVAEPALQITSHLGRRGVRVYVAENGRNDALTGVERVSAEELAKTIDLLVAIGGDGNFLRATRCVLGHDVPLIGVNRGRLGFLTDVTPDRMLAALDAVLDGSYLAERRPMLEARIVGAEGDPTMFALNDVVLQRGDSARILDFETTVDGSYVNSHGGDGLIVSTPTGSTAYALACNGPIIRPDVDALVMVPICPHSLSDRPLVLQSSSVIEVRVGHGAESPQVSCDGEELGHLTPERTLRISTAEQTVKLLHPNDYNYYELLRSKLNWGRANRSRQ